MALSESEFTKLITEHSGIIHKILYLYLDDQEDRNDLRQEILVQAWSARERFRGDATFSTWLYRVALNTVLTFRRKVERLPVTRGLQVDVAADAREKHPKSDLLFRAIRKLNDIDKTIITLHLEEYDHEEIADILGLTKNNVTVKLHRIKKALTEQLKTVSHG